MTVYHILEFVNNFMQIFEPAHFVNWKQIIVLLQFDDLLNYNDSKQRLKGTEGYWSFAIPSGGSWHLILKIITMNEVLQFSKMIY